MDTRRGLTGIAAALAVATFLPGAAAGSGGGSAWTLRFSFVPQQAHQGAPTAVSVLVKPGAARCALAVRYADGSLQQGLRPVRATAGRAAWRWQLALDAPAGSARASVSCGRSGRLTRTFTVVGGTVRPSKLAIVAQGYSQRPDSFGPGSAVSYGVVLDNPSETRDAQNVTVLVNFLDADGHVLQSATSRVPAIAASSTFDLGGSAALPSQTPVARLEIVVQTESYAAHALRLPALENVHIVPSRFEPSWVGEVDGDLVNVQPADTLTSAQLSIVLFDSAGNVVGGGTGFVYTSLPPGTRSYFSASVGFSAVPVDKATTAAISVEPAYKAPGG